jgi:MarR family 2-MHQ and catechol resistance regulon transcriptional repressor
MKRTPSRKQAVDASGTHLWLVMMKAHRTLQRLATRSIESSAVGLSDFAVMEMLLHKGPQPVNEIGRRVEAHPSDRRARIVRLTTAGEKQAAKIFAGHKTMMDLAASGLSKIERATLIGLLRKLGTSAVARAAPRQSEER